MRSYLIISILLLTIPLLGQAKCTSYGVQVFPYEGVIPANSQFIIQGFSLSRKLIDSIISGEKIIHIASANDIVELIPIEMYSGSGNMKQVILKPSRELIEDELYHLNIEGLLNAHKLPRFVRGTMEYKPWSWKVSEKDRLIPVVENEPQLTDLLYMPKECGAFKLATFESSVFDQSQLFIKAEVSLKDSDKSAKFIYCPQMNSFMVGFNGCAGNIHFEENKEYQIRFQIMDIAGNTDGSWTEWLVFDSPWNEKYNILNKEETEPESKSD